MIGLAYMAAAIVYFLVMFKVVSWAWRKGRHSSRKRAFGYATLGFLAVYLPLFWDYLPTVIAHRYYCSKDAGLVVYQTPEAWWAKHQGEDLRVKAGGEKLDAALQGMFSENAYFINKDVVSDWGRITVNPFFGVKLIKEERFLIDFPSGNKITSAVYYASDYPGFSHGGVRLWMAINGCSQHPTDQFYKIKNKLESYKEWGEK